MSESEQVCKTCKYWVPYPDCVVFPMQCDLMRLDGGPDDPIAQAISCSCCSGETGVGTKADFGCNQWEPKQ